MRKLTKYLTGILFGTFVLGTTAFAAEVTPVSGVGFTTENTEVRTEASMTGALVLTKEQCPDNIGVAITGVTDNGFWEVDLGQEQKFYIEGAGLVNVTGNTETAQTETKKTVATIEMPEELLNEILRRQPDEGYTEEEIQNINLAYAATMDALNIAMNAGDYEWHCSDIPIDKTYVESSFGGTELKYHWEYIKIGSYFKKLYPDYVFDECRARKYDPNFMKGWTFNG